MSAQSLQQLVNSKAFQFSILSLILFAAVLVGVETSTAAVDKFGTLIDTLNRVVLWAFVLEALVKMAQHGKRFYLYFIDPWNVFDFIIISVCFLPIGAEYAAVFRLARVFRALRLVTALPRLQVIVESLLRSLPPMIYVGILLLLLFYVYGVMGVFLFRANDPVHFGGLPTSMLTLFRVVTQEDWTDVMYIQMYGSDVYPYENLSQVEPVPSARPFLGAAFFVSFVFLGTMIMVNLFIGVILASMDEVQKERIREITSKPSVERHSFAAEMDAIDAQLEVLKQQLQSLRDVSTPESQQKMR